MPTSERDAEQWIMKTFPNGALYSNAAGIIPVVEALIGKGAAIGTVLAFMMAVIALSFPEMIILRKVLTVRLLAVFVAVVASGILAVGYLFNALFG